MMEETALKSAQQEISTQDSTNRNGRGESAKTLALRNVSGNGISGEDLKLFCENPRTDRTQVALSVKEVLEFGCPPASFADVNLFEILSVALSGFSETQRRKLMESHPQIIKSNADFYKSSDFMEGLKSGAETFMRKFNRGHLDPEYIKEEKVTNALDRIIYKRKLIQNYNQALENYQLTPSFPIKRPGEAASLDWFELISKTLIPGEPEPVKKEQSKHTLEEGDRSPEKENTIEEKEVEEKLPSQNSIKNTPNFIPSLLREDLKEFHRQEEERYINAHLPYTYQLNDGRSVWVAAVAKKAPVSTAKLRKHILLVDSRPSSVNLLSLVRDAAAKLPNSVGTRTEICTIVQESQYFNCEIDADRMYTIVSGALDRLHYENNPCVKFDSKTKMWTYLHNSKPVVREKHSESESNGDFKFKLKLPEMKRVKEQ